MIKTFYREISITEETTQYRHVHRICLKLSYVFDTSAIYSSVTHPPLVIRSQWKERRGCFLQRRENRQKQARHLAECCRVVSTENWRKTGGAEAAPLCEICYRISLPSRFCSLKGEAANIPDIFRRLKEPSSPCLSPSCARSNSAILNWKLFLAEIRETMVAFSRQTRCDRCTLHVHHAQMQPNCSRAIWQIKYTPAGMKQERVWFGGKSSQRLPSAPVSSSRDHVATPAIEAPAVAPLYIRPLRARLLIRVVRCIQKRLGENGRARNRSSFPPISSLYNISNFAFRIVFSATEQRKCAWNLWNFHKFISIFHLSGDRLQIRIKSLFSSNELSNPLDDY